MSETKLNAVTQGEYLYNFLGQQVARTTWPSGPGSETTRLTVHDLSGNRIAEYDEASDGSISLVREYIWLKNHLFAVIEDGETFWMSWDRIGRPVMATDASGAVVWQASYAPFGSVEEVPFDTGALSAQELRFPGQWFQEETGGLHQNWHRDYDPTTGRYIQPDPLGLIDGPSVYGYALQSPLVLWDSSGLNFQTVVLPPAGASPGPDWTLRAGHLGGAYYQHNCSPAGVEFHPGEPGKPASRGGPHWHFYPNGGAGRADRHTSNNKRSHLPEGSAIEVQGCDCRPNETVLPPFPFIIPGPGKGPASPRVIERGPRPLGGGGGGRRNPFGPRFPEGLVPRF